MRKRSQSSKLPEISSFEDLKYTKKLSIAEVREEYSSSIGKLTHEASTPKLGRIFFPDRGGGRLARGFTGMNVSSFIRRKIMAVKILRILDSVKFDGILTLRRGVQCHWSNGGRFFGHFSELAPGEFTSFRLRRVTASYVDNLSKKHRLSL
jgi:hypothetical protein